MAESLNCPASGGKQCDFPDYCQWKGGQGRPGGDLAELWAPITGQVVDEVAGKFPMPAVAEEFRQGIGWPDAESGEQYCSKRREQALLKVAGIATDAAARAVAKQIIRGERMARTMFNVFPRQAAAPAVENPDVPSAS